ncbi:hypothetical protein O5264_29300, partial [Escherichia coli]|nr:hypothetical protein [Escherichia coli]
PQTLSGNGTDFLNKSNSHLRKSNNHLMYSREYRSTRPHKAIFFHLSCLNGQFEDLPHQILSG